MAHKSPYSETMNLPRTEFPMRAQLPEREPERLAQWQAEDLYGRLRRARAGRPRWVLHDGPPYANGDIHVGTALNKILKDIVNRSRWLMGYDVVYVPGWDTHGLPIEHKALSELGLDRHRIDPVEVRRVSRDFALTHVAAMTRQFERLGVLGAWEHPYMTLKPAYEAEEVRVFGRMYERGLIVRGLRSVLWCPVCETALADAEIEYGPQTSPSLYVAFPLVERADLPEGTTAVIWTTTAWTLPANRAIALNPELEYEVVPTERGPLLLAAARADGALEAMGLRRLGQGPRRRGREFEGLTAMPPFGDRAVPLVLADYVTAADGTGLVHTAPGHGAEDFETGRAYGLDVVVAVDHRGRLTADAGPFAGLDWQEAEAPIVDALRARGVLYGYDHLVHEYPHCWRSKGPVLFRATEQWFCTLDPLRMALATAVDGVDWHPAWGRERMARMLAERDAWCISRQRVWGLPIPVLWCEGCGQPVATAATIERIASVFEREGADSWWTSPPQRFVPDGFACPACGGERFRLERDTLDVWFDAGSSHQAVLAREPELGFPADLYLEGTDQFRGWFNSAMITAVAARDEAPFRACLCHGFVTDGEGRKMSKSLGNGIDAMQTVAERGADLMRLWVVSTEFTADMRLSTAILDQVGDAYRKLRNTLRFLLANLGDYDPDVDAAPPDGDEASTLDLWAYGRLAEVVRDTVEDYRQLRFHAVFQRLYTYAVSDLSALYLDMVKDRLYAEAPTAPARRATQRVLYAVARWLVLLLAPIVPFTAEEAYDHLPRPAAAPDRAALCTWDEPPVASERVRAAAAAVDALAGLREEALGALERARAEGAIRANLEAALRLGPNAAEAAALAALGADVAAFFGTSAVFAQAGTGRVEVTAAPGERCERCWRVVPERVSGPYGPVCPRCADALAARVASGGGGDVAG
jgi:isoleucyl-tRNA synthetase